MKHTYPTCEVRALPEPHAVPAPLPRFYIVENRYPNGRLRPVAFFYVRPDGSLFESLGEASLALRERSGRRVKVLPMTVAPIPAAPRKKVYTLGIVGRSREEVAAAREAAAKRKAKQAKTPAPAPQPVAVTTCNNPQFKTPAPKRVSLPITNERVMAFDIARLSEKKTRRKAKARGSHTPITLGRGPLPAYMLDDFAEINPLAIAMIR